MDKITIILNYSTPFSSVRVYYFQIMSCSYYTYIIQTDPIICCQPRLLEHQIFIITVTKKNRGNQRWSAWHLVISFFLLVNTMLLRLWNTFNTMKSEVNLSDNYRRDQIEFLSRLSKYYNNKPFKDLNRLPRAFNSLSSISNSF